MTTLTARDFRSKMAETFDLTDAGERVFIRRKHRLYAIVPINEDELEITPELQAKIEKARKEYREGKTLSFNGASDAQKWMDEL
jgi:hypothetical protein